MKLYWSPASPYARKVRVVAHERRLTSRIEEIIVDAFADPAVLLAANALGKVPTLVLDDGAALYDSPVICAFLDAHPDARGTELVPARGPNRWRVLRAEALADGAMDLGLGLTLERRKPEAERSPTTAARWRQQLTRAVNAIAEDVSSLPSGLSLGHIGFACALSYLDFRHPDFAWREGRSQLAKWYEAVAAQPSLAATAPK